MESKESLNHWKKEILHAICDVRTERELNAKEVIDFLFDDEVKKLLEDLLKIGEVAETERRTR